MSTSDITTVQIGDIVDVAGLRAVVQATSPMQVKVAATPDEDGIWVGRGAVHAVVFRPGHDVPVKVARVLTKSPRTGRRSTARQEIDPTAVEVIVELPGSWAVTNFQQRGDNSYAVIKKVEM